MNNGHQRPRLAVPGQLPINVMGVDNGLATPTASTFPLPGGGVQVVVMGGLTKLEHVAALMLASERNPTPVQAVDAAKQLLAVCAEAQKPQAGESQRCGAIVDHEGQ